MLGDVTASPNTPTISLTTPNGGENLTNGTVNVTWSGDDADGDTLTYTVQYSTNAGATWETLAVDWPETNLAVNVSELGATTNGLMRVIVSDGFNSASAQSAATFTVEPHPPRVTINSPANGSIFVGHQQLFLDASADDMQDGALTGTNVQWSSDLEGALGSGAIVTFDAATLMAGYHTITVTATDNEGLSGSVVTHITVVHNGLADLAPVSVVPVTNNIEFYPPSPQSPSVQVSWTVTNLGTWPAVGRWSDVIDVSTNTATYGQIYVTVATYQTLTPIDGSYSGTSTVTLPQQSGTYYLIYDANENGGVYETNLKNNFLASSPVTLTYQVRPADLAPVSVTLVTNNVAFYPPSPQSPTVSVISVVTNEGLATALGDWADAVYISTNTTLAGVVGSTNVLPVVGPVAVGEQLHANQHRDVAGGERNILSDFSGQRIWITLRNQYEQQPVGGWAIDTHLPGAASGFGADQRGAGEQQRDVLPAESAKSQGAGGQRGDECGGGASAGRLG